MTAAIALVVAIAKNGVIGRAGGLPWRLPSDLKHFRALTLGKPMIMGGRTYRSIGKPLEGRDSIVLSRRGHAYPSGVYVAATLDAAIGLAQRLASARRAEEIMVIGGAEIYRAALPHARRVYLTLVDAEPEGDTHLGAFSPRAWRERDRSPMPRTARDEYAADFIVLERREEARAPEREPAA